MVEFTAAETDARLETLEDARRFFVQVWRDNPDLLRHGDQKLIDLMTPIWEHDKAEKAAASIPK